MISPEERARQERLVRRMRLLVIVLGVLLVAGFFSLMGRILYLAVRQPPQAAAVTGAPSPPAEHAVALPAGAAVISAALDGGRILVHYSGPSGPGLIVVDLATGRTVAHLRLTPEPR
jgi:ABC-type Mn2+/Zn2+ transport system permease subunit